MLSILPHKALPLIQDLILSVWLAKRYPSGFDSDSFIYLKARVYHVTERFDEAIVLYDEILNKTTDFKTRAACQLFKGMIFFSKKEFNNARVQLESIIESQPPSPWAGVAKKWAKKIKT
jgi:tetratricopeptide (TPR) repeat protein